VSDDALGARQTLSQVHAQAQVEALRRFGDGPAVPWQPPVAVRPAVRRALMALAAGAVIAASTWALRPAQASADAADTSSLAAPARVDVALEDDIVDAEPAPIPGTPAPVTPDRQDVDSGMLVVERAGATWHIDAAKASRLDVARRLAELSGSPLLGATELIARARPLDLRWQGRDLSDAWQAVLGPELNYALQCRRDRCQAWIVAAAEPGASLPPLSAPPPVVTLATETAPRSDAGDVPDRLHHD
jgi:hypothetical protein